MWSRNKFKKSVRAKIKFTENPLRTKKKEKSQQYLQFVDRNTIRYFFFSSMHMHFLRCPVTCIDNESAFRNHDHEYDPIQL